MVLLMMKTRFSTYKGLDENVIKAISRYKQETDSYFEADTQLIVIFKIRKPNMRR